MYKRYFRKKDPLCKTKDIEWVEMSGREYYSFVTAPENKGRWFVDMGDVVLECTEDEYKRYKAEDDHSSYILEQERHWVTQSLERMVKEDGCGEKCLVDLAQDVESEAIRRIETASLYAALAKLDTKSFRLIYALYLENERRTERELALEVSISQNAVHKQKKKILKTLKFLVVKIPKSSQ